jgi:ribosomal protein L28
MRITEVSPAKKHCRRRWKVIMSLHNWLKTAGSLKRKLDEGNFQSINVNLHILISVTLLS